MTHALIAALVLAVMGAETPAPSPSPNATASPASTKHSLTLAIPPSWRRTESGQYNEWRSPDGMGNFRIAVMPASPQFAGPNAADAVKATFEKMAGRFNKNASSLTVKTIQVCNGQQPAYRVDDPLGLGSAGFMVIIPGQVSAGLVNYEIMPGGSADAAILAAIDKICWP